ncbi:MAG: VWA domain-containing protein [Gemmataceae bacterium]|nr:VWA domain-containing protein [Gemmataceae bacterium]
MYHRRLPVYLLLDCSESLAGEPIEAVAQGVVALLADLRGEPMALETVYLGVITFATRAELAAPLTELLEFQPPKLRMGSGTALGAALRMLVQCLDRDVVQSSATQKGDWKPVVLVLTDGEPTDDWEAAADAVRTQVCGKRANVIAVACGPDAAADTLGRITQTVLRAADLQPGTLRALFKWVSASVAVASQRLEAAGAAGLGLPPLPSGAVEVATHGQSRRPDPDRVVFLHAKCVKTRQFYLIRYEKRGRGYEAVAAHPADDFDLGGGGGGGPTVAVDKLGPPPACPCCGNDAVSFCGCGRLFCSPPLTRPVRLTCPWCGKGADYAPGGGFDVGRGRG